MAEATGKAKSTWTWQALGMVPPVKSAMTMRAKASIQAAVMVAVGLVLYIHFGHRIAPAIVWALAALVLAGGLFYPPLFRAIETGGQMLARWVAAGLTWGLLVPFYFLCFLPGRILLWLIRKDPMDRRFPSESKSLWVPRPAVRDMNQYRKQH